MPRRFALAVALLAGACLLGGAPAGAATGVSIDVGRIAISQKLSPAGAYRLPAFGVRNPGTDSASYRMGVSYIDGQKRNRPPEGWFRFSPSTLSLAPGETRPVKTRIELPTGADPGDYEVLIGAEIITEKGGAQVGAAAAARLSFTVEPASLLEAWWLKLNTFVSKHSPWTWLVPLILVVGLALRMVRRRFSISVARRA